MSLGVGSINIVSIKWYNTTVKKQVIYKNMYLFAHRLALFQNSEQNLSRILS